MSKKPEAAPTTRVGKISTQIRGVSYSKHEASSVPRDGYVPILRATNITEHGLTFDDLVYVPKTNMQDRQMLQRGDIVVAASSGSLEIVGKASVVEVPIEASFGAFCKVIRPGPEVYPAYLGHFFRTPAYRSSVSKLSQGANINNLKSEHIDELEIPLPRLDEQKRIAAVLDKADNLRRQRQESLQLTEKLLLSIFLDTFGDPVTNPKDWPSVPLAKLGILQRGMSKHRPRNAPELLGGKYPLIQTGEVSRAGLYIKTFSTTYSETGFRQSKMWPKGTLCITIAANIAQTGILDFDACFPDSVVGFVPHEGQSNSVYVHFLFGFLRAILERNAPQAAQKNINLAILRALEVPKPPYELQQEFANVVVKAMAVLDDQTRSLSIIDSALFALQQRAFQGNLDLSRFVLDPDDDTPFVPSPAKPATETAKSGQAARFLRAPARIESKLVSLDRSVNKDRTIRWSADYFRYRILAAQPPPFSFADLMEKAATVFDEPPPHDVVTKMIFDLLGQGEAPALLRQRFDLRLDSETNEVTGRKKIVFEPVQ